MVPVILRVRTGYIRVDFGCHISCSTTWAHPPRHSNTVLCGIANTRETEVSYLDVALSIYENIVGFEVVVNDSFAMQCVKTENLER